jgi:CRISPR-associated endonuclease Csn1
MKYRLGIDLGSTSLGWCILLLDDRNSPSSVIDMGVRIFPDGREDQKKQPLAVGRRMARGMRRTLDRRDLRQKRLMACLVKNGLMPDGEAGRKALEALDPYELRAKALDENIPLHHLGRALFHINQRRGFKSNRKTDKRENDSSAMKAAIKDLDAKLMQAGCRTLGEYLWLQKKEGDAVRVKARMVGNKNQYNFYPDRKMYMQEVEKILEAQKGFHADLEGAVCDKIKDIIFFQRSLLPPVVGSCRFESGEKRIRKAHPLFQKFRILQEVNHLGLVSMMEGDPVLEREDKEKICKALISSRHRTFGQLRTLLDLPRDCRFNLETESRKDIKGEETAAIMSVPERFGKGWRDLTVDQQESIIDLLFVEPDPDELVHRLMTEWGLSPEQAEEVAGAPLEDGYAALSRKAIEKIMPGLEKGMVFSDAVSTAYPHHSDFRTGEVYEELPYYGQVLQNAVIGGSYEDQDKERPEKYFGKINNPTVHIALNQLRKLVNALLETYGRPEEIVVELARDLKEPVDDVIADQAKNKKDNDRINKELEKLGVKQNYANRMKYKLWEDLAKDPLKRCCPFSGIQISETQIFSEQFEIEHLLPFSRSFNDGRGNKVLSSREWNRKKGNKTPYEAFSHLTKEWPEMLARVQNLSASKQWRFKQDAWEIAKGQGEDIIARQLNDTRYMSRVARQYLSAIFDNERGKSRVWAIPGQMTALLRRKWGLNDLLGKEDDLKDRTDHRHHAIDAAVVACTDRSALKKLSDAARKLEESEALWEKRKKLVSDLPEPFDGFRHQVAVKVENIIVSYKPDHGGARRAIFAKRPYTVAALHDQTAYGLIGQGEKKGTVIVATRKPVESLTKLKHIGEIADPVIRKKLTCAVEGLKENSTEWKKALTAFAEQSGTKRVRIHIEKTAGVMIPVLQPKDRGPADSRGKAYKLYALGGNYCAEVYCADKGKKAGQWQCEIISNYHAHQKDFIPQWRRENPTAKLVMRLHINDMVAYEEEGETIIRRVRKLNNPNKPVFVNPLRAKLEKNEGWAASPNQMQLKNARKVSVDILGRIKGIKLADAA